MFLPSIDDNCAEVTIGVVEAVVELLATLCCEAAPHASLLVVDLLQFILLII